MRVVVSVVAMNAGMDGGGGKELLSFVDGAKSSVGICRCAKRSRVTAGIYSIGYKATVKLVWQNW